MGSEIDLAEWKGYRGDMGTEGKTYFDEWRDISGLFFFFGLIVQLSTISRL